MKKKQLYFFWGTAGLIFLTLFSAANASAEDLWTVYQQALMSDPVLKQAAATRAANQENLPQSEALLLPALSGAASTQSIHFSQPRISLQNPSQNRSVMNTNSYDLTLVQPLFNFQNWMQLRSASDVSKQADAAYNAALQDLIIRTARAYFDVLQQKDILAFTQAEKKAVGDQLKQIQVRYQVGMATMTDVYQAQANYDALNAKEISAQNNVLNSLQALKQITNQTYEINGLAPLKEPFLLITPQPLSIQQWIHSSEQHNWQILAARYGELSAKENVRVNYGGHFPTLNAVGNYQRGNSNALGFGPEHSTQWESSAGLEVNVPIFQGGLVVSKTRQAQDQYLAADDQTEIVHRQVVLQTQQAFNNVISGISQVKADRAAVISAQSALDSTKAGYKAGTKTILDVLTAEQNFYQAKSSLAADRYAYILNTLLLKQAAGSLNAQDIPRINDWLNHGNAHDAVHHRA